MPKKPFAVLENGRAGSGKRFAGSGNAFGESENKCALSENKFAESENARAGLERACAVSGISNSGSNRRFPDVR